MKSQVFYEFKEVAVNGVIGSQRGATFAWESPRLTTMYPRPGAEKGSDRAMCRTVNGVIQLKFLEPELLFNGDTGVSVTAGLWGEYGRGRGVMASTKYYLDGRYADDIIVPNPAVSPITQGYGVPMLNSNGKLGFNAWSSFSNQAQNIYIRVALVRDDSRNPPYPPIPIKMLCSGILIAADLG